MTFEEMPREWDDLPPQAKKQVADFIAFLHARQTVPIPVSKRDPINLKDEPYVGMWQDRPEMADSSAWVRTARVQEWRD